MHDELLTRLIGLWRRRRKRDSANLDQHRDLRAVSACIPDRLESPEETPLAMARRHVGQGERHVTRQAQIFEEALAAGMDVERTEALLATCLEFLRVARERLRVEEMKAAGRTQDVSTGAAFKKSAFAWPWSPPASQKNAGIPPL